MDEYVLSKAWKFFRQKKFKLAIDELEKNRQNSFYDIDYLLFNSEALLVDGKFEEAEKNYATAIEKSNEKKYYQGLGYAYLRLSDISYRKGKFEDALKNANLSLNFFENNNIKEGKLDINNNIGLLYFSQGYYKEAETVFNRTLEIAKSLDSLMDIIRALNNLGIVLHLQGEHQKALLYYENASKYSLKSDEAAYTRATLVNNIADLEMIQGFYNKAEKNFLRALDLNKEQKEKYIEGLIYQNLGSLYSQRGEFERAENAFFEGIKLFIQLGRSISLPGIQGMLAEHYRRKGDFDNATIHFKESIILYEEQSVSDSFYQNILCLYVELLVLLKKDNEIIFNYLRKAQKIAQRKSSSQIEKARVWLQLSKISLDNGSIDQSIFLIDEYVLPVAEAEYAFTTMINAYLSKTEALLYKYKKSKNDEQSLLESKQTMAKLIDLTYNKGLFPEYIKAQFLNSVLISTTPEGKEEGMSILQNAITLAEKYGIMNLEYLGKNIAEELASREELTESEMVDVFERNIKTISYRMFLTDKAQKSLNETSMILIAQDKTGPNIFSKENADDYTLEVLLKLATFTAIAIGQGDSYNKGLFGPMPVPNKKEYLTLLFSFSVEDKTLQDHRYKGNNYALIAFLVHTDVIHFFYDRGAIKEVFESSLSNISNLKSINAEFLASLRNKLLSSCVPKWKSSTI